MKFASRGSALVAGEKVGDQEVQLSQGQPALAELLSQVLDTPGSRLFAPLADAYRAAGRQAEALEFLARGIATHPRYVSALVLQAQCQLELGREEAAEETFARVLQQDPENLVAMKYRAERAARCGNRVEASLLLDRILEVDPWDREARQGRMTLTGAPAVLPTACTPGGLLAACVAPNGRRSKKAVPVRRAGTSPRGSAVVARWAAAHRATVRTIVPLVVAVAVGGSYAVDALFSTSHDIPVTTVKRGEFLLSQQVNGQIEARKAYLLSAPRVRNLQITWVAPQGSQVKPGDVVIRFDASQQTTALQDLLAELKIAETSLQRTRKELAIQAKQLELEVQQARRNYDEQKYEAPKLAQEAKLKLELAELNHHAKLEQIQADVEKAKLEVQRAHDKVATAERELDQMTLTAPIAGMVVYVDIWRGGSLSKVQAGDSPWPNQPLISLPDFSEMIMRATVSEVDASKIEVGQEASVRVDAFADKAHRAKVIWRGTLAREKAPGSKLKVFDVELAVLEPGQGLRPGMSASARIVVDRLDDVVSVPLEAIFDKDGRPTVYLENASPRGVQVGRRNDQEIEIVAGLRGGERICLLEPGVDEPGFAGDKALEPELNRGRQARWSSASE